MPKLKSPNLEQAAEEEQRTGKSFESENVKKKKGIQLQRTNRGERTFGGRRQVNLVNYHPKAVQAEEKEKFLASSREKPFSDGENFT